jgi:hypothetical protein
VESRNLRKYKFDVQATLLRAGTCCMMIESQAASVSGGEGRATVPNLDNFRGPSAADVVPVIIGNNGNPARCAGLSLSGSHK